MVLFTDFAEDTCMFLAPQAPLDDSKFFEAAQSLAQSLSQWGLLIIGGSLVVIVSTSYRRPQNRKVRAAYFLFIPMWCCLAVSVYEGIMVQRSYVAYLVASRSTPTQQALNNIAENITNATRYQILALESALLIGALWLLIYIVWWICSNQPEAGS
ncbi:MAG TPA: hypothetical protein VGR96_12365 [Acidobacteriaceae bacterium]|nr:hypothetical protein [Acidobacteriaceae bacterium]